MGGLQSLSPYSFCLVQGRKYPSSFRLLWLFYLFIIFNPDCSRHFLLTSHPSLPFVHLPTVGDTSPSRVTMSCEVVSGSELTHSLETSIGFLSCKIFLITHVSETSFSHGPHKSFVDSKRKSYVITGISKKIYIGLTSSHLFNGRVRLNIDKLPTLKILINSRPWCITFT